MGTARSLGAIIASAGFVEQLFDRIPDVVFFVKDLEGRYRVVNSTLVERCGAASKAELIGRTADNDDLFGALGLIRTDPADAPTVDDIARSVGLSAYQLNRRLKGLLGITARQLLTKTRIDAASRLLSTTTLPIGDVAHRSGYFDQSAFTRQLRRSTGLTPRQYRERHRTSESNGDRSPHL